VRARFFQAVEALKAIVSSAHRRARTRERDHVGAGRGAA
jgi:hypothetical protein